MPNLRRTALARILLVATAAFTVGLTAVATPAQAASPPGLYARRAATTEVALQRWFGTDHGLLHETAPNRENGPYSYEWPYSQAMVAAIDLAGMRGGARFRGLAQRRIDTLERYWNPHPTRGPAHYASGVMPPLGGGGDAFYDDNEWDALALIQWYQQTGDASALRRARQLFNLFVYGWDGDSSHACPGGVFWTQASWSSDRNTVSNGPAAEVGAHLYLITGQQRYLRWAKRMVAWTDRCLLAPNGLYYDHISLTGEVEKTQWSYNQGVMLGAKFWLWKATGDRTYLSQSRAIAATAMRYYAETTDTGQSRYFAQDPPFHAIFFANLLQLGTAGGSARYVKAMATYERQARQRYYDASTGLFRFNGQNAPVKLLEQAAMVRIQAMLAWSPRKWHLLT